MASRLPNFRAGPGLRGTCALWISIPLSCLGPCYCLAHHCKTDYMVAKHSLSLFSLCVSLIFSTEPCPVQNCAPGTHSDTMGRKRMHSPDRQTTTNLAPPTCLKARPQHIVVCRISCLLLGARLQYHVGQRAEGSHIWHSHAHLQETGMCSAEFVVSLASPAIKKYNGAILARSGCPSTACMCVPPPLRGPAERHGNHALTGMEAPKKGDTFSLSVSLSLSLFRA